MAVRLAIGAGRATLIRHLLVELLLSCAGAALGLVFAVAATLALLGMLPPDGATLVLRAEPDARILLFGMAMALATGTLFGVIPALQATTPTLLATLKGLVGAVTGATGSARSGRRWSPHKSRWRSTLMAAGLFAGSLANLRGTCTGFEAAGRLVSFQVDPAKSGFDVRRTRAFYMAALDGIRALPGVTSAAYAMWPLLNGREWDLTVVVDGHPARRERTCRRTYNLVSPDTGVRWASRSFAAAISTSTTASTAETIRSHGTWPSSIGRLPNTSSARRIHRPTYRLLSRSRHHAGDKNRRRGREFAVRGAAQRRAPADVPALSRIRQPRSGDRLRAHGDAARRADPDTPRRRQDARRTAANLRVKTLERQLDETLTTERMIAFLSVAFGAFAAALAALASTACWRSWSHAERGSWACAWRWAHRRRRCCRLVLREVLGFWR